MHSCRQSEIIRVHSKQAALALRLYTDRNSEPLSSWTEIQFIIVDMVTILMLRKCFLQHFRVQSSILVWKLQNQIRSNSETKPNILVTCIHTFIVHAEFCEHQFAVRNKCTSCLLSPILKMTKPWFGHIISSEYFAIENIFWLNVI